MEKNISRSFQAVDFSTSRYAQSKINLKLFGGEILGITGLMGSGRTELVNSFFGVNKFNSGRLIMNGNPIEIESPQDAIRQGIFLVPEDRRAQGIIPTMSVTENLTFPNLDATSRYKIISSKKELALAKKMVYELGVRTPELSTNLKDLSGGNQQKIAIGKWLSLKPELLIFDEPTRGVDVGAKAEIYGILRELASSGVMIIVVSSDMEEVINISHRILVMHEGKIAGELTEELTFTEENIMRYAVGL